MLDDVITVPLTQHKFALIDAADSALVLPRTWHVLNMGERWYAASGWGHARVYLHRFLTDAPKGMSVDHVNGDGLDNRQANLRICNQSQNTSNSSRKKTPASGFRGVWLDSHGGKDRPWRAKITVNRRNVHLGSFATAEEAAHAYDRAARLHFGEFARTNFS